MTEYTHCTQEESVALAMRTGHWADGLRSHVAECAACREVLEVSEWMRGVRAGLEWEDRLPDPTIAWLKAKMEDEKELAGRRVRRTVVRDLVLQIVLVGAAALSLPRWWPLVRTFAGEATASLSLALPATPEGRLAYLTSIGLLLVLAVSLLLMRRSFRSMFSAWR